MLDQLGEAKGLLSFIYGVATSGVLGYFFTKKGSALDKAKAKKINNESTISMWRSLYETQSDILEKQAVAIHSLEQKIDSLEKKVECLVSENHQLRIDLETRDGTGFKGTCSRTNGEG